jgi:hypothetical protein
LLPHAQIFPADVLSCATVNSHPQATCRSLSFSPPLTTPEEVDLGIAEDCDDDDEF